jgi:hypothetical protein
VSIAAEKSASLPQPFPGLRPLPLFLSLLLDLVRMQNPSAEGGEATDFIAFVVAVVFFLRFQPKKRMSSPQIT